MLSINRIGQQRLSRSTGTITKRHRLYISDSLVNIVIMLIMRQHTIRKIVAGEEISSLTGCYSTPKCENLIVFSDEYFKKAQNEWKDIEALTGF